MTQRDINIKITEFMKYLQDLNIEKRLKKMEKNQNLIIEYLKKNK